MPLYDSCVQNQENSPWTGQLIPLKAELYICLCARQWQPRKFCICLKHHVCLYRVFHLRAQQYPAGSVCPHCAAPPSHITELKAECTWQQQEEPPCPFPTHTGPELPAITWHELCCSITPISASARTNKTKILPHWELASCSNDCRTALLVTTQNKPSSSPWKLLWNFLMVFWCFKINSLNQAASDLSKWKDPTVDLYETWITTTS